MSFENTSRQLVELDRATCLEHLAAGRFGRIVTTLSGEELIRPVNYVYDPESGSVLIRTHPGSKLYALRQAREATFEIDEIDEQARTGWSVIVRGMVEEITRPWELRRLQDLDAEPWAPHSELRWIRIRAFTVSGRRIEG